MKTSLDLISLFALQQRKFSSLISIENKPSDATTKLTPSADLVQPINLPASKTTTMPTASPKPLPKISKRDTLLRLRRQLALEDELSSAADESENLGIEQVSSVCSFSKEQPKRSHQIRKRF